MKATDLMIGDWVLWKNRNVQIVRTCALVYSFGHIDIWLAHCNDDNNIECHDLSKISPIPLTPEILEKNGFVFRADNDTMYGEYYLHNQSTFAIKMFNGYLVGMCMSEDLEFHYVHELQHALRLCGLDELADNFKV